MEIQWNTLSGVCSIMFLFVVVFLQVLTALSLMPLIHMHVHVPVVDLACVTSIPLLHLSPMPSCPTQPFRFLGEFFDVGAER